MPYLTEFIDEGTGILHVGKGVLTGEEIIAAIATLAQDMPHAELITHVFIDLTEVTSVQVSTEEVRVITAIDKKNSDLIKQICTAIVAPEDLAYGMSRMYAGLIPTPGWSIGVFRTMPEARVWLVRSLHGTSDHLKHKASHDEGLVDPQEEASGSDNLEMPGQMKRCLPH